MKNKFNRHGLAILAAAVLFNAPGTAQAVFDSGSDCGKTPVGPACLGAFSPTTSMTLTLPPDGVFHYTTVTIPSGVDISFKRNAANTPVTILASENVSIAGNIWVGYSKSPTPSGQASSDGGVFGDDGMPGIGGPGGFDGGSGGLGALFGGSSGAPGGSGKGPGGGPAGSGTGGVRNGGGGAFASVGGSWNGNDAGSGAVYGQVTLLPLVGGSGGGGGAGGSTYTGGGGGGGGGAILIASSKNLYVSGYIQANGGGGAESAGVGCGGGGAGGSGGAIRLVADTLDRGGPGNILQATGGSQSTSCNGGGQYGGNGYIRLEAATAITANWSQGYANPDYTFATVVGKLSVPNNPTLTIASVNGTVVPANPTGVADITLASGTGAVPVVINATNIPVNTAVTIYLVPTNGARSVVSPSPALSGTDSASSATSSVTFTTGNTTIMASVTYTVTELIVASLPKFNGEAVAKIRVDTEMGGKSKTTYITATGKEYPADAASQKKAAT
jgi:hypothetical protein